MAQRLQANPGPVKAADLIERLAIEQEPIHRDACRHSSRRGILATSKPRVGSDSVCDAIPGSAATSAAAIGPR